MKIKELRKDHPRIYELAMLRQKEAGNGADDNIFLHTNKPNGGFEWESTVEGYDLWNSIDGYNFQTFYDKYPQITEIKKGDRFRCIEDFVMDSGETDFHKDLCYISPKDNHLINDHKENHRIVEESDLKHFIKLADATPIPIKPTAQKNWNPALFKPMTEEEIEGLKANYREFNEQPIPNIMKETVEQRTFISGSKRDNDDNKPLVNHLDPYLRLRFGYLLRAGARRYGKGNWKLGQDTDAALESLHRHLAKFELNLNNEVEQDEDHLMAILFNLQLIIKNEEKAGITVDQYYGTTK